MANLPRKTPPRDATGFRIALITSRFNAPITDQMRHAALAEARRLGAKITIDVRAPGVYDIPAIALHVLARRDVDALVALGAVITGQTRHDEVVTFAAAHALSDLAVRTGKPIGLGITGPGQTKAQAAARVDRAAWAVQSVSQQLQTIRALQAPNG